MLEGGGGWTIFEGKGRVLVHICVLWLRYAVYAVAVFSFLAEVYIVPSPYNSLYYT